MADTPDSDRDPQFLPPLKKAIELSQQHAAAEADYLLALKAEKAREAETEKLDRKFALLTIARPHRNKLIALTAFGLFFSIIFQHAGSLFEFRHGFLNGATWNVMNLMAVISFLAFLFGALGLFDYFRNFKRAIRDVEAHDLDYVKRHWPQVTGPIKSR